MTELQINIKRDSWFFLKINAYSDRILKWPTEKKINLFIAYNPTKKTPKQKTKQKVTKKQNQNLYTEKHVFLRKKN